MVLQQAFFDILNFSLIGTSRRQTTEINKHGHKIVHVCDCMYILITWCPSYRIINILELRFARVKVTKNLHTKIFIK